MTRTDQPDPLSEAFGKLPRQRVSSGFTDEVLAALDRAGPAPATSTGRILWAAIASVVLAAMLVVGVGYQRQQAAKRAYQDQIEELRSRYAELLDEVATVRQEAAAAETRLYLGGDERVDLILDLSQTSSYLETRQNRRDIRPAALEE